MRIAVPIPKKRLSSCHPDGLRIHPLRNSEPGVPLKSGSSQNEPGARKINGFRGNGSPRRKADFNVRSLSHSTTLPLEQGDNGRQALSSCRG